MKRVNIKYLVVCLMLILSLLLGTSCSFSCSSSSINTSPPPSSTTTTTATPTATPIDPDWTLPYTGSQAPELPSIADVVAKVKPSVVAINTEVITYDIFNQPFTQEGAGSGWIIDEDGLIVTNNHVVEGAKSITVTLDDGATWLVDMNAVATDRLTDLAVLKITAENLPAITIGDSSKLRVGDWVIAIGNALGEGISATHGIVSRKDASISVSSGQTLYDLIQTNAAINPGNSGGPLVNLAGEVIGITSAKLSAVGIEGMGYAISSNAASQIIEELVQNGYIIRPWLGVVLYTVDPWLVLTEDLGVDKGAFITYLAPDSPADIAGLEVGDIIVSLSGEEIASAEDLIQGIHSSQIGQEVEITFWRVETKNTTYATLIESPPPS